MGMAAANPHTGRRRCAILRWNLLPTQNSPYLLNGLTPLLYT